MEQPADASQGRAARPLRGIPPGDEAGDHAGDSWWPDYAEALRAIEVAGGLVTQQEIASEWGVSPQAIAQRISRGTFPKPVKVAGRTRLYLRAQLEPYKPA